MLEFVLLPGKQRFARALFRKELALSVEAAESVHFSTDSNSYSGNFEHTQTFLWIYSKNYAFITFSVIIITRAGHNDSSRVVKIDSKS